MRNLRTSEEQSHSASNIPMVRGGLSPPIIAQNTTASYIQLKRNDTWVVPYNIVPGTRVRRYIRTLPTHKTGATAARCNKFLPPQTQKNFPREHPPYTKRNKSSLCMGGCSWGKFWEGQGGLEGRKPSTKEGFLRLQGLLVFLPHAAKASTNERNSARSEWRSRSRPRNFARTVA